MSDKTPIGAADFDDFERDLLGAARVLDRPPAAGKARALSLLGVGAAAGVVSLAPRTAGLATYKILLWSLLGVGVLGGALVYAARAGAHGGPAAPATAGVVAATAPAPSVDPEIAAESTAAPVAAAPEEIPSAEPRAAAVPRARAEAPPAPSSLARQLAVLHRARQLMEGGRAAEASQALEGFDRQFPEGALAGEAAVLRVEALSRAGRVDEARALARRALAEHPGSHAALLDKVLREAAPPAEAP